MLVPDELLVAWVGEGYARSADVLLVLGLVAIVHQLVSIMGQYFVATRRQRRLAEVLVPVALGNVLLSVLAARWFGIEAVAWATLVADVVALAALTVVLRSSVGVGFQVIGRSILRPALPAALGAVVVLAGLGALFDPDSLLRLAPIGVAWLLAGAALVWRYGFSARERVVIRQAR